eukprot:1038147-Prorocentrum_minimum.AAC.2
MRLRRTMGGTSVMLCKAQNSRRWVVSEHTGVTCRATRQLSVLCTIRCVRRRTLAGGSSASTPGSPATPPVSV